MQREIKFRFWKHGEMCEDFDGWSEDVSTNYHFQHCFNNGVIVLQFTGYRGSKGIEIYEGDILQCGNGTCSVVWQDGGFAFKNINVWHDDWNWADDSPRFKVIGNIYENENLLHP